MPGRPSYMYVAVTGRKRTLFQNAIIEKNMIKNLSVSSHHCTTAINLGQKAARRWIPCLRNNEV